MTNNELQKVDDSVPVLDPQAALDRLDDDDELYRELVELYLEDTPKQMDMLKDVLVSGDSAVVERQAHSIKSASANVGLERMRAIAGQVEASGREGQLALAKEKFEVMEAEFIRATEALGKYS